ncbi:hypothetical protein BLOT_000115 [Blomia tropicalis]|nr:hypothetical protein BLOT_000115 [Blomia tropicalis]
MESSETSTETSNAGNDDKSLEFQPMYLRNSGYYFRSVRLVLLLSLCGMAIIGMTIFTQDVEVKRFEVGALFVLFSNWALVALGIYGTYHVRVYYVTLLTVLLFALLIFKFTTIAFQNDMLHSMMMHIPHFFKKSLVIFVVVVVVKI